MNGRRDRQRSGSHDAAARFGCFHIARYDASVRETLDVQLPANSIAASEYEGPIEIRIRGKRVSVPLGLARAMFVGRR